MARKKEDPLNELVCFENFLLKSFRVKRGGEQAQLLKSSPPTTHEEKALWGWARCFRNAVDADVGRALRDEYGEYNDALSDHFEFLKEAYPKEYGHSTNRYHTVTAELVVAATTYLLLDGQNRAVKKFLDQQKYVCFGMSAAKYIFTFGFIENDSYGILRGDDLRYIDLADLVFHDFTGIGGGTGYYEVIVSRADRKEMPFAEIDDIEQMIREDIRYNFTPDEIWIEIDCDPDLKAIHFVPYFASYRENVAEKAGGNFQNF